MPVQFWPRAPVLYNKEMIKYIIFDLGGVIVESGTSKAIKTISKTYSIAEEKVAEFLTENSKEGSKYRLHEITKEEFWKRALMSWGKTIDPEKLNMIWVSGYHVKEGMLPILKKLKQEGYVLGVLSNTVEDRLRFIDSQVDIKHYFTQSVISYKDRVIKPDKKAFELILHKLHVTDPSEAVYIDDKKIHADVAKSLGMHALVCENAIQLTSDLRSLGVRV